MKIINILFCLFLLMLNGCNSNDNDTLKNNAQQTKSRRKRDLTQKEVTQEKPKSKEELLREKLNDDQKTQLDWLKTALTDAGEFDKFLENNEDKIKSALDHIKSELDKCNGKENGDVQKNTFKQVVQGALKGGIDGFGASNATTTCNGS
ncbi:MULTISPECIES: Mlp family lipoprotein [Borreliella]|uniref:Lipoprotein MlpH n=2 Tax=Borreliella burgdorferi TaxID=139 RepID=MLPH_BORBU|nr:Mlp family lipoprotein [Borreliella burgdorferi]Q9S069.1 RecName: Full=Lipoprotein MlpH; Flags: Precursor [Borreliella burgdorferi B31]AAF07641.1 lipoprotein [Borreliella burgdorferi B31]ACN24180.1 surface protein, mlp lipoprotein family [Borreliella burgdorferi 64b]MCR8876691.1 Mlp family lipoprotein [Borreliella burgdorferi]MDK7384119.1 Mlp family lipoprotein [Borreliella burgdorferi]PRR34175.1 lipoprotein [Borreliella burgdorferi]